MPKLSFIPHITSLKSRCSKSLDLIKVLYNTTWGADRKVLLRLYRALIRSKFDYGCIVYGSASVYVKANEPSLDLRKTRLSLQYCVKLVSNEVNPA